MLYTAVGLKIMSYPYPVDTAFTNTALAIGAATGDQVSIWDNGWTTYTKLRAGWPAEIADVQIAVGDAVLFKASATREVIETKPYTLD
jgi:hypothetical protein